MLSLTRREFIGLSALYASAIVFGVSGCTYVNDVKTVDMKDKYFNSENLTTFGEYVKRCAQDGDGLVDVIYVDEGAIDVKSFIDKYGFEEIYNLNDTTTTDTLTTTVAEAFFDSFFNDSQKKLNKFTVYNNPNYNLKSMVQQAVQNHKDNGVRTVIFLSNQEEKDAFEYDTLKELNKAVGEAQNECVVVISPGGKGGEEIDKFKYSCLDNVYTINSCDYDGSARGIENISGETASVNFAIPSDNSLTSAALFAADVSQIMMKNNTGNIAGNITSYIITDANNDEDTCGSGILSLRELV